MSGSKAVVRWRILVTGRVQGVYFRASARDRARALGLVGWVRNCSDGRVELEAQGPSDRVARLAEWAHQGPPAALVSDVVESQIDGLGSEQDFQVRY